MVAKTENELMREAEVEALREEVSRLKAVPPERTVRLSTEGFKDDDGKPAVELIQPEVLLELGKVLSYGARKYSRDNWRKGMAWLRPVAASLRHTYSWMRGEDLDPESGLPHLAHAMVGLMMALSYQMRRIGSDDRWKESQQ